ncbi:MAG: nicotinate (nicotinamide) nucleotide adenylyltransferase [Endomicrobium sp.]|jgi:nicotinate-nucleotide adenylyltransferase|nr:nicotinate (nicotinamide) nucleotide adenylyltransferase [Endomicrobium sp.]
MSSSIAIFGGSFDPVHKSHIQIANLALNFLNLNKLIFVIAYTPPHKIVQYASIEDRISMLKLATYNMNKVDISNYEAHKKMVVYSYQTLDYFRSLYQSSDIYMVIGSDSLINLFTWKNIDYIAANYKFIVVKRINVDVDNDSVNKYLSSCVFINEEIENISSTKIRELIKINYSMAIPFLDTRVYNYIVEKRLYR